MEGVVGAAVGATGGLFSVYTTMVQHGAGVQAVLAEKSNP